VRVTMPLEPHGPAHSVHGDLSRVNRGKHGAAGRVSSRPKLLKLAVAVKRCQKIVAVVAVQNRHRNSNKYQPS